MLDNLGSRFQDIVKKIKGHGKLSESNISDALREVRLALLEADVNYKVVKDFISRIKEKAVGEETLKGINPGQQFIKIVNDELVELLGGTNARLTKAPKGMTVIMLSGLQGAGKTTFAAKLAKFLKGKGERPYLVGADIYRPAAMKQLQVLGESIDVPVFTIEGSKDAVEICRKGLEEAENRNSNYVLLDTAGRLHIDEELMNELKEIKKIAKRRSLSASEFVGILVGQAVKINPDEDVIVIGRPVDEDVTPVILKIPVNLKSNPEQLEKWLNMQTSGILKAMKPKEEQPE